MCCCFLRTRKKRSQTKHKQRAGKARRCECWMRLYLCLAKKSRNRFLWFVPFALQWKRRAPSETTTFTTCARNFMMCVCLYSFLDRMDEDRTDRGRSHFSLGKQTLLDPTATQLKSCTVVCMIVCYFIFVHPFQETLVAFVSVSVLSNVDPCLFPTLTD